MAYTSRGTVNRVGGGNVASARVSAVSGSETKTFNPTSILTGVTKASSVDYVVKADHAGNSEGEPQHIASFVGESNKGLGLANQDAKFLGVCNIGNTVLEIFFKMMSYDDNSGADRIITIGTDTSIVMPYLSYLLLPGQWIGLPSLRAVLYHENQTGTSAPVSAAYGTSANFTLSGTGATSGDSNCTDGTGYVETDDLWGQTRTAGIVPGSITVNFYSAAYQEFGITSKAWAGRRQTPSSDTGLAANTAHRFKVTPDGGSAVNCVFTTDSADTTWGSGVSGNGVLKKINDEFLAEYKSGNFVYLPRIHLVDGDIRVTSGCRLSSSAIALADSSTGSESQMFGTGGIIPHEGSIDAAVAAALETPITLKRDGDSTSHLLIDQGNGKGTRGDGGSFELRAGISSGVRYPAYSATNNVFILRNCPAYANFKVTYNYNAAHSGGTIGNGIITNMIQDVFARSVNTVADQGKVKLFIAD